MESVQESDTIIVRLTSDEALVLDSLLARFDSREFSGPADALVIQHPAERAALWALQAALEKVLVGPLKPDYPRLLEADRGRLAEKAGV